MTKVGQTLQEAAKAGEFALKELDKAFPSLIFRACPVYSNCTQSYYCIVTSRHRNLVLRLEQLRRDDPGESSLWCASVHIFSEYGEDGPTSQFVSRDPALAVKEAIVGYRSKARDYIARVTLAADVADSIIRD